jgi:hypothetical protein
MTAYVFVFSVTNTFFTGGTAPPTVIPLPAYGYHQKFIDSYLCGIFAGISILHYCARKLKCFFHEIE